MDYFLRNTLTHVWAFLMAVTIAAWGFSQNSGASVNPAVTIGVLLIAFIKVQLVIWYFMEVKDSPDWLKKTCCAWLGVTALLILCLYTYFL